MNTWCPVELCQHRVDEHCQSKHLSDGGGGMSRELASLTQREGSQACCFGCPEGAFSDAVD